MAMMVRRPGMSTTVQDLGRRGLRSQGVPLGGAVDTFALRVANMLVGNAEGLAALEIALIGPEVEFEADTLVAICGAGFDGVASWQPFVVSAGEPLSLGPCLRGSRGYLAVAGGFPVDEVLGSRGTYLTGGFGGWQGRALKAGDVVPTHGLSRRIVGRWHLDERVRPGYGPSPTVRFVRSPMERGTGDELGTSRYRVAPQSDRIGLRLEGPRLSAPNAAERLSSAVLPGSIQVPPEGQPIVLLADAQTLGGYPLAGHVIGPDLPILAQLRPGEDVGFKEVSLDEAHAASVEREATLSLVRQGLADKFS